MAESTTPPPPPAPRSSSQTSTSSRRSQKSRTVRAKPVKRLSGSSSNAPTDLTSFPSLSPDASPEGFRGEPALSNALSQALLAEERHAEEGTSAGTGTHKNTSNGANTPSNDQRGRKATLAGLTTSLPHIAGRSALFNDAHLAREIPGSLHLARDEHIERMIARTGAVKLIRQFARDLALRDAEISTLRSRADERERELKKMLREVQVSNNDIESRLYLLENPSSTDDAAASEPGSANSDKRRGMSTSIDDMVTEAMGDDVGTQDALDLNSGRENDLQATIRPQRNNDSDTRSGSSVESVKKKPFGSIRQLQDYFWGSSAASRKTSGASSLISEVDEQTEDEAGLRIPSSGANLRRTALDDQLFQPPEAAAGNSTNPVAADKKLKQNTGEDDASLASQKSSKSATSWTVRMFAGQSGKDKTDSPKSTTPDLKQKTSSPSVPQAGSGSAQAALKRLNGTTGVQPLSGRSSAAASTKGSVRSNPVPGPRRVTASTTPQNASNAESAKATGSSSINYGPVEMDAILPMESRPPTLAHIYDNYTPGELLTDRFGFIYDQRRNKRQKESVNSDTGIARNQSAGAASYVPETGDTTAAPADDGATSITADTPEEVDGRASGISRWQDYLKIATKPTELLSHTPAAAPIVPVESGDGSRPRVSSASVDKRGALSVVNSTSQPSATTSNVVSNNAEFSGTGGDHVATTEASSQDQVPVKLLLQRLTDLHDTSQGDRTVKWNEFMRKVRAERQKEGQAAASSASERSMASVAMPEASLTDGEVVGIAGLGNKGRVGRAKWKEFKGLVLGGVPVAYRPKVWSECSGASALRVPGYYDELVRGNGSATKHSDETVPAQIDMDIHRTLTDNIFFRKGPGVARLKEVLLAYSRRNPEVGYCQGMNLIAGSLLLIMPTAEDAFWVLASIVENILPAHYYDHGLLASRADQQVLRQYVAEVLPKLSSHLDELGIELEALTFQWFLSVFTDCLSAEALYRVWDVVLCLSQPNIAATEVRPGTSSGTQKFGPGETTGLGLTTSKSMSPAPSTPTNPTAPRDQDTEATSAGGGGGSTFFFQVALALLKLNEQELLTTCSTPAAVYTYINHQMTNHAISIDGLIQASEALRNVVRRDDVVARRAAAMKEMTAGSVGYTGSTAGAGATDGAG